MNFLRMNNTKLKRTLLRCKQEWGTENISRCSPFPLELVFPLHHREVPIFYINIVKYFNIMSIFITTKNVGFFFFVLQYLTKVTHLFNEGKNPRDWHCSLSSTFSPTPTVMLYLFPSLLALLLSFSITPESKQGENMLSTFKELRPQQSKQKIKLQVRAK